MFFISNYVADTDELFMSSIYESLSTLQNSLSYHFMSKRQSRVVMVLQQQLFFAALKIY